MQVKYNYLGDQFSSLNVEGCFKELRELVASGEFTLGPYVEKFERKFADYIKVKHVISVNNGTDALILCLKALGIGAGDQVITVTNSFYATAGAIVAVGARPVFVDSDDRYQIDPNKIEEAITARTRAIIPVHWAGCPPQIDAVMEIAKRHNLYVVEDACPAVGAKFDNKFAGTFGHINAFSMHPLKPLNVWGDGGMVVTDDDNLANYLKLYRNHGMVDRDHIDMWGINARLQPVQAIVGCHVLDTIENLIAGRNRNARLLDRGLAQLEPFVKVPSRPKNMREVYQLYLASFQDRDNLLKYLIENQVEAKIHYPVPLHLQKPGLALGYVAGDFPNAEKQANEVITLPSHQFINEEQINYMLDLIKRFYTRGN